MPNVGGGVGAGPNSAAGGGLTTMTTKFHRSSIKQSTTTSATAATTTTATMFTLATTVTTATTTTTNNQMTALTATISAPKHAQSHIPSYQATNLQQQQRYKMRDERDHPLQHHQPSQLPQPVGFSYKERENGHNARPQYNNTSALNQSQPPQNNTSGSGSSSATSLSPQTPPSIQTALPTTHHTAHSYRSPNEDGPSEMGRLYRKSPFMQRKYGGGSFKCNSAASTSSGGGGESPKKESVLTSIGQSIMRNLTTSPFAQKKHPHQLHHQHSASTPQPNQVDPQWRMPNSFDGAVVDGGVSTTATKIKTFGMDSPFAARKRYTADNGGGMYNQTHHQPTALIPLNRHDSNSNSPRVVQGNQSPIVLQRFYHQQNQLREKELEKERQQQQQQQHYSTNPFVSSAAYETPPYHQSHIPVPSSVSSSTGGYMGGIAASSSSQSTSSQSSTQSTSSQINTYELRRKYDNSSPPPPAPADDLMSVSPSASRPGTAATPIFGVGTSHLQYQPLPQPQQQQHPQLYNSQRNANARHATQERDHLLDAGEGLSKLEKLYGRRASTTHCSSSDSGIGSGNGGVGVSGHTDKDGLSGRSELHSQRRHPTQHNDKDATASSASPKSHFYRSATTSSNNTSPTTATALELPIGGTTGDFHENAGAGTFLRRYANGAMGGNPHLMGGGLDRRHRSPDPPPRYNRGQSPLLLRKNLLELSGQPPGGSPMLQRRYVSASPPLPPPRRGSESVPGSPQHFRTRIHYTPEPQRRIYRTIDQ